MQSIVHVAAIAGAICVFELFCTKVDDCPFYDVTNVLFMPFYYHTWVLVLSDAKNIFSICDSLVHVHIRAQHNYNIMISIYIDGRMCISYVHTIKVYNTIVTSNIVS